MCTVRPKWRAPNDGGTMRQLESVCDTQKLKPTIFILTTIGRDDRRAVPAYLLNPVCVLGQYGFWGWRWRWREGKDVFFCHLIYLFILKTLWSLPSIQSALLGLIPASQHLQAVSAHHGNQKLFELNEDLNNLFHMSPRIHMLIGGASRRVRATFGKHPQLKTPYRRINTEQMTARWHARPARFEIRVESVTMLLAKGICLKIDRRLDS